MINNKKRGNNFALKLFATVTSLLLAASVITTAVCFATNTWQLTPKDDVVQEQPEDQTPEEDQTLEEGGMQIGEAQGSGIKVMSKTITAAEYEEYGISPMAESAQQLTATITPEDATNKAVDWTVRFKDASSEWATGKTVTDYVTVTPTLGGENYELQARLSFQKTEDGKLKLTPHFVRHEPRLDIPHNGYTFTDEDKQALKQTGNLGKLVNVADTKTGEMRLAYVSIDRLTNEIVDVPTNKVRIPNRIGLTELSKAEPACGAGTAQGGDTEGRAQVRGHAAGER